MTDKELLKHAAKAINLVLWPEQNDGPDLLAHGGFEPVRWNPLDDDGAALRLAVALRITVKLFAGHTTAMGPDGSVVTQPHGDPYTATRMAIVLLAASIGMAQTYPWAPET